MLDHPQIAWDGSAVKLCDPERGVVRQPGPLAELSETPGDVTRSAPTLGADQALLDSPPTPPAPAPDGDRPRALPIAGVTIIELAAQFAAPHGTTALTRALDL